MRLKFDKYKMGPKMCYRTKAPFRYVEPFSIAAQYQHNVEAYPPCKLNIFKEKNVRTSLFRALLLRGDIPCNRSFCKKKENQHGTYLMWKTEPQNLDYSHYLPIFFDGLCELHFPYNFIARYGIHDMLHAAGEKVLPVIPQLIFPIRKALNTKNCGIIMATLRVIQHLCMSAPCVAQAMVPFFRQILPIMNLYYNKNINTMGCIDYDRVGRIGDIIDQTLNLLEHHGGPDAYINIKYLIPTYESCTK